MRPQLFVLDALDTEGEGDDPLTLHPHPTQFDGEAPPPQELLDATWNDVITRGVFGRDYPPRWVLLLTFDRILLIERGKWTHNRLLRFDLDEILGPRGGRHPEGNVGTAPSGFPPPARRPEPARPGSTRTATSTPLPSPRT